MLNKTYQIVFCIIEGKWRSPEYLYEGCLSKKNATKLADKLNEQYPDTRSYKVIEGTRD